jgi:hypothetical protein
MAKKSRPDEVPNPNSVANRDILQRLNFLFQASTFLQSVSEPPTALVASSSKADGYEKKSKPYLGNTLLTKEKPKLTAKEWAAARAARRTRTIVASDLAKCYVRNMKQIGKKATVRMCVLLSYVFALNPCDERAGTRPSSAPSAADATAYSSPEFQPRSVSPVRLVVCLHPATLILSGYSVSATWSSHGYEVHAMRQATTHPCSSHP